MAAVVDAPPSSPPAGVTIVGEKPPAPPPPPKGTIHVTDKGMSSDSLASQVADKPAMESLRKSLRKKAGLEEPAPAKPPETPPAVTPKPEDATSPTDKPTTDQPTGETPPTTTAPATDKPGKTNPWKLVDEYKARTTKAEARIVELEKNILPEQDRATYDKRMKEIETRNKELEQHIAYVDYEKSAEFKSKFQVPYESAWKRAMTELKTATVLDPGTQQQRPIAIEDMLELVNQPLPDAINNADAKFGRLADYVIERRNEIRSLWDQQRQALEEAKTKAVEHAKEQLTQAKNHNDDLARSIQETWNKVNTETLEHPQNGTYFKPREGQPEWNQRLAKGFELADNAFASNPRDPNLTAAQRADVIARHAAVRNRAAGWGPLKWENTTLKAENDALKKELAEYKSSTPPAGGSETQAQASTGGTAMERMMADLRKKAH